jgi:hypothetical protein
MERAQMKRHPLVLSIAAAGLLLAAGVLPLAAQRGPERRPVQFYADLGYVNLFAYPKWISVGPELELRLGRYFSLNPDVTLWIGQSFARKVKVVPGLTANVRLGRITLGGGAVYRLSEWPEDPLETQVDRGWLMPKAQIGYTMGPARLTLSLLFPGGTNDLAAGLTIAMGFGGPSRD